MAIACSVPEKTGTKEYLLRKNRIKIDNPRIPTSDLEGYLQQKASKKFLFSLGLNVKLFDWANQGKQTGIKRWLNRAVVEKPVYLDTNYSVTTVKQIKTYLNNIGYFNSLVSKTIKYKRKSAIAIYRIKVGKPYTISKVNYSIPDENLKKIIFGEMKNSLIQPDENYNAYKLDNERGRITWTLKNNGYYAFAKEYINFIVDSSIGGRQLDISIFVNDPKAPSIAGAQQKQELHHRQYYLNDIFIYTDYNPLGQDSIKKDSLTFIARKGLGEGKETHYHFIFRDHLIVKPKTITNSLFLSQNDLFNLDDADQSYTRLTDLGFFRFINIDFRRIPDSLSKDTSKRWLDAVVQVSRNKISALTFSSEGTNTGGDLGVAGNVVYENRNIFRGSELFSLKLRGAMEVQRHLGAIVQETKALFNTFQAGAEAGLVLPKFFLPVNPERFSKYFRPKTTINTGFNYEARQSFQRYLTEVTFGYDWRESKTKRHILNPIEINSVRIFPDSVFTSYLNSLNDKRLVDQYTDHLITALRYSFIFNNQQISKRANFDYLRLNLESAGNLASLYSQTTKATRDEVGKYSILHLKFAQYVKVDGDFRHYYATGINSTVVYRLSLGYALPYGNSTSLPFEKGFYSGGANGMRGWPIRSLGPGSFANQTAGNYDQMGEILMESNIELRFPVFNWIHGALFGDAGNVWLRTKSDQFPGGEFKWDSFYKELAVDAGFGIRLDFSFFVFRIDGAIPFRIPSQPEATRTVDLTLTRISDVMWNFGIGYPF